MKILYVTRSSRLSKTKPDFYSKLKQRFRTLGTDFKRHLYFSEIDGFFEASLHEAGDVTRIANSNVSKRSFDNQDAIVVNFRCVPGKLRGDDSRLIEIAKEFQGVKALFVDADKARIMPSDAVLDNYDIVFKREPFLDLDRYPITYNNKKKIKPTMLSCRYFIHSPYKFLSKQRHQKLLTQETLEKKSDVFFIGKASHERIEAWSQIKEKNNLTISGGLLPRQGTSLDPALRTEPISEEEFISCIKKAHINLAIDGHGEFTFRHLEIWCAGGFLLAHANLKDIWLPLPMREHKHFECYNDTKELIDKIEYFSKNSEKADKIAKNGHKIFLEGYSATQHGNYIIEQLNYQTKENT